jgi:hypothetical protein
VLSLTSAPLASSADTALSSPEVTAFVSEKEELTARKPRALFYRIALFILNDLVTAV